MNAHDEPLLECLLRLGDSDLVLAQRLGAWIGHGPVLEEDIALANVGLDLLGQARLLLGYAGEVEARVRGRGRSEDELAFLRDAPAFRNVQLVEQPNGDYAATMARQLYFDHAHHLLLQGLARSRDERVAAIASKGVKEARYHVERSSDWVVRLGDGTAESAARMKAALDGLWPYFAEIFESDAIDDEAVASGLGPRWAELAADWRAEFAAVLEAAGLELPPDRPFRSTGKSGRHSEHLGYILAEMQHLQRTFPGGVW